MRKFLSHVRIVLCHVFAGVNIVLAQYCGTHQKANLLIFVFIIQVLPKKCHRTG